MWGVSVQATHQVMSVCLVKDDRSGISLTHNPAVICPVALSCCRIERLSKVSVSVKMRQRKQERRGFTPVRSRGRRSVCVITHTKALNAAIHTLSAPSHLELNDVRRLPVVLLITAASFYGPIDAARRKSSGPRLSLFYCISLCFPSLLHQCFLNGEGAGSGSCTRGFWTVGAR